MVIVAAALTFFLLALCGRSAEASPDPCEVHTDINDHRRSTAYTLEHGERGLCDDNLIPGWYRFTSLAGGAMPEECVERNHCGTGIPIWMNGTHPTVSEGPVSRAACANFHAHPGDEEYNHHRRCCEKEMTIGVKNCAGDFFVYYLYPAEFCPAAFCAGDRAMCGPGTNSTTGFPPCQETYPKDFEGALPWVSEPEVLGRGFVFNCNINYTTQQHRADLTYEVQWTFDGQPDPNIPDIVVASPETKATLPGTALKNHMGTEVGCRVRAYYRDSPVHQLSNWKNSTNTYWAGIKVTPHVEVWEKGGNQTVTVTSTIPILCGGHVADSACCLHLDLHTDGPSNNVVMPHSCHYSLCSGDWNPATHSASTHITVVAAKDQIRDGTQHLHLTFDTLHPVGGGPFLNVFSGYHLNSTHVVVHDAQTHSCSFVTDPHFHTFNGMRYSMFHRGDFTVYENTNDKFELQARTYRCNGRAACTCAVAIYEQGDLIRIDACHSRHGYVTVEVATRPLRTGTVIHRSNCGRHVMVYMPSGREVKVDSHGYCLNTVLTVPGSDEGHGHGLCGTLDSHSSTDFMHRDHRHYDHCHQSHRCQPDRFIYSWSNPQSTSLFESVPHDINTNAANQDPAYCQCDANNHGSARNNCTADADVPHKAQQCGTSPCPDVTTDVPAFLQGAGHWSRRSARGAVYMDLDEPDPPMVFPTDTTPLQPGNVTWPTPTGITLEDAEGKCREAMQGSQLFSHCSNDTQGLDFTLSSCVTDILYGDSFEMVEMAVAHFTAHCQFTLRQDPQNYAKGPDGSLVIKAEFADVCSVTCLRHGRCQQGACVCEEGFTGDNCDLRAGEPPMLERVRGSPICDLNHRPCRTIYFDASHFQMSDDFKCRVQATETNGTARGPATEGKAKFISGERLACPLPDVTDWAVTNFSISVTFDGVHYSEPKNVLVYDSNCLTCDDHHCLQNNDSCLINHLCHQNGDFNPDDGTKMCNTSASIEHWTTVQLGQYPKMTAPELSGPDDDLMLSCAVHSTDTTSTARFQVTWYSDDSTVLKEQVVEGDAPTSLLPVFGLPHGNLLLHCKVKSFYAGQDVYSPELSSTSLQWTSAK